MACGRAERAPTSAAHHRECLVKEVGVHYVCCNVLPNQLIRIISRLCLIQMGLKQFAEPLRNKTQSMGSQNALDFFFFSRNLLLMSFQCRRGALLGNTGGGKTFVMSVSVQPISR